MASVTTSFH